VIAGIAVTHLEAQDIRSLVVPANHRGEKSVTDKCALKNHCSAFIEPPCHETTTLVKIHPDPISICNLTTHTLKS
jgi:hypothetical protein